MKKKNFEKVKLSDKFVKHHIVENFPDTEIRAVVKEVKSIPAPVKIAQTSGKLVCAQASLGDCYIKMAWKSTKLNLWENILFTDGSEFATFGDKKNFQIFGDAKWRI